MKTLQKLISELSQEIFSIENFNAEFSLERTKQEMAKINKTLKEMAENESSRLEPLVIQLLKSWIKEEEKLETELSFLDKHDYNLEAMANNNKIKSLVKRRLQLQEKLNIEIDREKVA